MVSVHSCIGTVGLPRDYFDVRYEVLRKPLASPRGSECLTDDDVALHVWATVDGQTVAVGRAALIAGAGEVHDPVGSHCPAFAPLIPSSPKEKDDKGQWVSDARPALQIRQMGTLEAYRGTGLAAQVLARLEADAVKLWLCRTGWLQARTSAIGFYQRCGWVAYGAEYHVDKVGLHRSMWRSFNDPSS